METLFLNEYRCKCGKLLLKGLLFNGIVEIKCRRCGEVKKISNIKHSNDSANYVLIMNDKGIVTNASNSACRILGYTIDELIGKSFTQINPTMSHEIGKKLFGTKSVLNEDNYFKLETTHQSKEGKKIPVTVFLKLDQSTDKEKYILVTVVLKNSVLDKKISGKNLSQFLDYACDFYFDVDKNGIVEYLSPTIEKLFGLFQETIIGKSFFDLFLVETKEEIKKTFEHFSTTKQPYRATYDVGINLNCKAIRNDLYFTPKFNDSGKFVGYRVLGWVIKNPNLKGQN